MTARSFNIEGDGQLRAVEVNSVVFICAGN